MERLILGQVLVAGSAAGRLLYGDAPLSFWGGYDASTGAIIDPRHPLAGQVAAGKVLAIPFTKGSSTTSAVLLEAVRGDRAPAAILTSSPDTFLALASIVADEIYGRPVPVVALGEEHFGDLAGASWAAVHADGRVILNLESRCAPAPAPSRIPSRSLPDPVPGIRDGAGSDGAGRGDLAEC